MNSVWEETTNQDNRDKYKQLFKGDGYPKDYALELNIDYSVKPVARLCTPLSVRKKVV